MNTEEKNDKSGYLSTQTHIHSLIHTIKLYVYTHTHTHTHTHTWTYKHGHTHTHTHTRTHTHTHTPIHTPTHKERNNYTICSDNDCNVDNTDAKVLVTTEGFMSEVRSWSAPVWQLSGRPIVAGTDELNSLIFIKSKIPLYLVMTDQSASSTASMPTLPSSLLSRF